MKKSLFILVAVFLVVAACSFFLIHKTSAQNPTPTQQQGTPIPGQSLSVTLPPAQQLQFLNQPNRTELFDESFVATDWSVTQLPISSGGAFSAASVASGGYAGSYWGIGGGVSANGTLSLANILKGSTFNPSAEGTVLNIDAKIRTNIFLQNNVSITYAALLFQNGVYYAGPPNNLTPANWAEISLQGLSATSFTKLYGNGGTNPDFSCGGKEISVGFLLVVKNTANLNLKFNVGVDNYSIVFNSKCCTASAQGGNCCGDDAAEIDPNGNVIYPNNLDPDTPPSFQNINVNVGAVSDLYPGYDTSVDTWYKEYPCDQAIGGLEPDYVSSFANDLTSLGITDPPQTILNQISVWEQQITTNHSKGFGVLDTLISSTSPLAGPYTPPTTPHIPRSTGYILGGRDIVFVHGLKLDHLQDEADNISGATTHWKKITNPATPGNTVNPEFYGEAPGSTGQSWTGDCNYPNAGYYWKTACKTWKAHIKKYMLDKGIKNRFIIVAYPNNERLQVGAQVILKQIADAMQFGTGVFDLAGSDRTKFGTPSYVIISHSTGGLAADVAMSTAAKFPNLGVKFVSEYCKAHIASQGAFSGSEFATVPVAVSLFALTPWGDPMAAACLSQMGSLVPPSIPNLRSLINKSVLVDLVPLVTQTYWGSYLKNTPVKTLTLVGAHPTTYGLLKILLHRGFDDGVLTINSQVANPNSVVSWPSGYTPKIPGLVKVFDMGLSLGINQPFRALAYGKDQLFDPKLNPVILAMPRHVAGTATPYISPTGMLQPVSDPKTGTQFDTLARYPNHYSFTLSTSDHFTGTHDKMGEKTVIFNSEKYEDALDGASIEETRVITDKTIYASYGTQKPYPGDDQPLVKISNVPRMVEIVRGRSVTFRIKIFKKRITKTKWIWKRRYHLLDGWESKKQFDYIYESVLKN